MGAYLKNRPEEGVNEALAIIATGNGVVPPSKEFTNVQPALNVIERFGPTTYMPRCHHHYHPAHRCFIVVDWVWLW